MLRLPPSSRAIALLVAVACLAAAACTVDRRPTTLSDEQVRLAAVEASGSEGVELAGSGTSSGSHLTPTGTLGWAVARGDLDGDELEDAAAVVVQDDAGVPRSSLVLVLNDFATPIPLAPVALGGTVVVEDLRIRDAHVVVELLGRSDGRPSTVGDRRRTVEVAVVDGAAIVMADESVGVLDLVPSVPDANPLDMPPGQRAVEVQAALPARSAASYSVDVQKGQRIVASIQGPLGVSLSVHGGGQALLDPISGDIDADVTVPDGGTVTIEVRNIAQAEAAYVLSVEVLAAPPPPPPGAPPAGEKVMFLTFDDGPHATFTPQILDVLARHEAKATFFVLGSQAQAHPDLVDRIVAEGHTLANHTWSHPSLVGISDERFASEVGRTQELLGSNATACLRPPYGAKDARTEQQAAAYGLRLVLWTIDTFDWQRPGASAIAQRIVAGAATGANVLMHDGGGDRTQTVAGLEQALSQLSAQGWKFRPAC